MGGNYSKPDPSETMQVIGAGYSRTGTSSMQLALERLLDGPVQHGGTQTITEQMAGDSRLVETWFHAMRAHQMGDKERALKYVRKATAGFVGITDMPGTCVLPELMELYPDAKVVLVTRDPEKWYKSIAPLLGNSYNVFFQALMSIDPGFRWFPATVEEFSLAMSPLAATVGKKPGDWGPWLIEAHNKMVLELVPPEKLLVMELSEGWEPLCKFLGKPIPKEPFPRVNDAEASDQMAKKILLKLGRRWLTLFAVLGGTLYGGFQLWKWWNI